MMGESLTIQRALFTKFLIPGLSLELDKKLDDWLELINPTNHPACYLIHRLIWDLRPLKICMVRKGLIVVHWLQFVINQLGDCHSLLISHFSLVYRMPVVR